MHVKSSLPGAPTFVSYYAHTMSTTVSGLNVQSLLESRRSSERKLDVDKESQ